MDSFGGSDEENESVIDDEIGQLRSDSSINSSDRDHGFGNGAYVYTNGKHDGDHEVSDSDDRSNDDDPLLSGGYHHYSESDLFLAHDEEGDVEEEEEEEEDEDDDDENEEDETFENEMRHVSKKPRLEESSLSESRDEENLVKSPVIRGSTGQIGINFDYPLEDIYKDLSSNSELCISVLKVLNNAMTIRGMEKGQIMHKLQYISSCIAKYRN